MPDFDELERLARAATPGPWRSIIDDTPEPISCGITCFIVEQNMEKAA